MEEYMPLCQRPEKQEKKCMHQLSRYNYLLVKQVLNLENLGLWGHDYKLIIETMQRKVD